MPAAFLSRPPASDTSLLSEVRRGHVEAVRPLYERHHAAVYAYAATCARSPRDAYELVSSAFSRMLQRLLSGQPLPHRGTGCVRRQLYSAVRSSAIAQFTADPESLTPGFRAWVAAGAPWTIEEDSGLAAAFELLPAGDQCLLWHSLVERDAPVTIACVTGFRRQEIQHRTAQVRRHLERLRVDLYLDHMRLPECRAAVVDLLNEHRALEDTPPEGHIRLCSGCQSVYRDLRALESYVHNQLPGRLLGWWPTRGHLRTKEACPPSPAGFDFLARAAGSQFPNDVFAPGPFPERRSPAGCRHITAAAPLRVAAAVVCATLTAAGAVLPPPRASTPPLGDPPGLSAADSSQSPPPSHATTPEPASALSAHDGFPATAFTAARNTTVNSAGTGIVLDSGSVVTFGNVRFSADDHAVEVLVSDTTGGPTVLELRLGSVKAAPFARLAPPPDGQPGPVRVPIPPLTGVHRLFVTVQCPGTDACTQLHRIATRPDAFPGDLAVPQFTDQATKAGA